MSYSKILLPPIKRSLKRLKKLRERKNISLCRALEYEAINGMIFKGKTLDIGGGRNNSYYDLVQFDGAVESLNIDEKYYPTIIADLNYDLPIEDNSYDNFICLNTYEHIRDDHKAIEESFRILKNGGHFVIAVPFLYKIHASPYDFSRRTPYWWESKFQEMGLDISQIVIEPLVWDTISTSFFTWHPLNHGLLAKLVMLRSVFKDRNIKGERLPHLEKYMEITDYSLAFLIKGKKIIKNA